MSRPSIKLSLVGLFVAVAAIFVGFSWLSLSGLDAAQKGTAEIATNRLPKLNQTQQMAESFSTMNFQLSLAALTEDADARAALLKRVEDDRKRLLQVIEVLRPTIVNPKGKEILAKVDKALADHGKMSERFGALLTKDGDLKKAGELLRGEMLPQIEAARTALDEQVAYNKSRAEAAYGDAVTQFSAGKQLAYGASGLCLALVLAAATFVVLGIARPITRITGAMRLLAGGDTARAIPYAGRGDEVGAMAGAVEVFRLAAIENDRLTREAEAQRLDNERRMNEMRKAAADEARRQLLEATGALAAGLRQLADGDLSYRIRDKVSEDFTALVSDFNTAVVQLSETLAAVALSIGTIDGNAQEIANSAGDLAKRTEQQAAALEETAAALDEITVNVGNATRRAVDAQALAAEANLSARKSAEVIDQAKEAMGRIESSSGEISKILGVIDEIAFQTNLLALNAGVEAARAGEAGKGFAVVAQEVRELAQRSAAAAKDIKELIRKSEAEVGSGVRLVSGTGDAMKGIEHFIANINTQLSGIANAAGEQSTGLSEVNTSVNQMDQVTQRNAAMVEETTAATVTLAQETSRLRTLIGRFRFDVATGHAGASRGTYPAAARA